MPLLSVCIPVYKNTDFAFLKDQNYENTELILAGPDSLRSQIKTFLPASLTTIELDNTLRTVTENDLLNAAQGEYAILLNPFETWNARFLSDLKKELAAEDGGQTVLYGLGFVQTPDKTMFAVDFLGHLGKANSLVANFYQPKFFTPAAKYVWRMCLVREYALRFDTDLGNWQLRQALFNLDYLSAAFENAGYVEPKYRSFPLGFLTKAKPDASPEDLATYQDKVQAKEELWRKNIWHPVYWLSRLRSIIGQPTLSK